VVTLRFDYEGDGDSEGELGDLGLTDWVHDVEDAARFAVNELGAASVSLFGLRLGASIALLAAPSVACRSLLLWEPIVDGNAYLDECLRTNLTTQLATHRKVTTDRKQLRAQLAAGTPVNVGGYEIGPDMARSLAALDLARAAAQIPGPLGIISLSRDGAATSAQLFDGLASDAIARRKLEIPPFWHESRRHDPAQPRLIELSLELIALAAAAPAVDRAQAREAAPAPTPAPSQEREPPSDLKEQAGIA
jgi:uncharacterized protein